jgi:hypothetical protein
LAQTAKKYSLSQNSPEIHIQLLSEIKELQLLVETPTETVLRLIYQVNAIILTSLVLYIDNFIITTASSECGSQDCC